MPGAKLHNFTVVSLCSSLNHTQSLRTCQFTPTVWAYSEQLGNFHFPSSVYYTLPHLMCLALSIKQSKELLAGEEEAEGLALQDLPVQHRPPLTWGLSKVSWCCLLFGTCRHFVYTKLIKSYYILCCRIVLLNLVLLRTDSSPNITVLQRAGEQACLRSSWHPAWEVIHHQGSLDC